MLKKVTEARLNRELLVVGWVLVVSTLCVVPFYIRALLKYPSFAAGIAADEDYSFSRELTLGIVDDIGFVLRGFPLLILGALFIGLLMVMNVHKRKKLPNQEIHRTQ